MYQYRSEDALMLKSRVAQFCNQIDRFLKGDLDEDEFKSLRLANGLYLQKYAPMLRVAIPYGVMSSVQLRTLASIAKSFDRNYFHISTRQNVQFNWIELKNIPEVIKRLAEVGLHSVQTSGQVIRNITSDPLSGVSQDEAVNPWVYCELMRQWSFLHPEFQHLPRKFKIAVFGAAQDRVASKVHDIGIKVFIDKAEVFFEVSVGGGLGRTPMLGKVINPRLPEKDLLLYLEAIVRTYNLYARRDNMYKSRIKILVQSLGAEVFAQKVEEHFQSIKQNFKPITPKQISAVKTQFTKTHYPQTHHDSSAEHIKLNSQRQQDKGFDLWLAHNSHKHQKTNYLAVTISLKRSDIGPGDLNSEQSDAIADLADEFNQSEIRTTKEQNILFAHIFKGDLYPLYQKLKVLNLTRPNADHISNITCCPGLDYCSLADAFTHDVTKDLQKHFEKTDPELKLTQLRIGISGCINSCAHHHVCDIGILGLVKGDEPHYQIRIGGHTKTSKDEVSKLGIMIGPSLSKDELIPAIDKILNLYHQERHSEKESFAQTIQRLGDDTCKARLKELIYA